MKVFFAVQLLGSFLLGSKDQHWNPDIGIWDPLNDEAKAPILFFLRDDIYLSPSRGLGLHPILFQWHTYC